MRGLVIALCLGQLLAGQAKWRVKYFHDKDDTALAFEDLTFVSPALGLAAGVLVHTQRNAAPQGVLLITTDGGARWTETKLPDIPVSLFALDQGNVWLVGREAVWKSNEFGRAWTKLGKLKGALRVYFLDEKHGFAVGLMKSVWQSVDGGVKWTKVPEAQAPKTREQYTAYTNITFVNQNRGLISGFSRPPRRSDQKVPAWMDPEARSPEVPSVTLVLETNDGGKNWSPSTTSTFGQVRRVVFGPKGGLTLIEFEEGFQYPSEVHRLSFQGAKNMRVFREKNRAVKDAGFTVDGSGVLAAIERKGELGHLPIPGRLRIYESADLATWTELNVDYKAVANSAVLSTGDLRARFVATDTGMILKYE